MCISIYLFLELPVAVANHDDAFPSHADRLIRVQHQSASGATHVHPQLGEDALQLQLII